MKNRHIAKPFYENASHSLFLFFCLDNPVLAVLGIVNYRNPPSLRMMPKLYLRPERTLA